MLRVDVPFVQLLMKFVAVYERVQANRRERFRKILLGEAGSAIPSNVQTFARRLSTRGYLFKRGSSEAVEQGARRESGHRGIKYDRPADLHVFAAHVTSVGRRSMLSFAVISQGDPLVP